MPHVTLEYSANLAIESGVEECLVRIHRGLADLGVDVEACKGRAYRCESFAVGSGTSDRGFLHLTLAVMDGRSEDVRRSFAEKASEVVRDHFAGRLDSCDLTVEVRELRRAEYVKVVFGPRA